jgi:pimeloyl-ACP methyl ester carboxylesterase
MARALSDRLRMVAPDLVGHGKGPALDPTIDFHDQTTKAASAHLPDGASHLIGHSFGATLALRIAIETPDRVRSLTLIEPVLFAAAAGCASVAQNARAMAQVGPLLDQGDNDGAARLFLSQWGGGVPFDAMPAAQRRYMADRMWIEPASGPALVHDRAQLLPRLGQVRCPVLLIEGAGSPPVIADIQAALAKALPDATRTVIDGAGHMLPITHPQQTAAAIRDFLDRS